jgi:hypothetical protein
MKMPSFRTKADIRNDDFEFVITTHDGESSVDRFKMQLSISRMVIATLFFVCANNSFSGLFYYIGVLLALWAILSILFGTLSFKLTDDSAIKTTTFTLIYWSKQTGIKFMHKETSRETLLPPKDGTQKPDGKKSD